MYSITLRDYTTLVISYSITLRDYKTLVIIYSRTLRDYKTKVSIYSITLRHDQTFVLIGLRRLQQEGHPTKYFEGSGSMASFTGFWGSGTI